MRSLLAGAGFLLVLAACVTTSPPAPTTSETSTECRDAIAAANRRATARAADVTRAYASVLPELTELALTGAIRTGTIIFKGIDDRPAFAGVPEGLQRLTRPLEKKFDEVRRATRLHLDALESVGFTARACSKAAEEAGNECMARSASEVARSADEVVRLVRRRLAIEGDLQDVTPRIEQASGRIEQASLDLSSGMAAVEACLT